MSTPVRTEPTPDSRSGRIRFVDALRGVAALAVVLHHYNLRLHWGPLEFGNLGVPVFFVLSGFVVTMSVGDAAVNATFIGRFALRRVLRLDPPYWATMALVIGMGYALAGLVKFDGVTAPQVVAHMFYLQDFLGFEAILPVFWTLCYEVQFYLSLVVLLWACQAAGIRAQPVVIGTLVLSVLDRIMELTPAPFMGRFWYCFALGALVYWARQGEAAWRVVAAAVAAVFVYGVVAREGYALTSAATAAAITTVLRFERPDFLSGPVWQFLGRISYSLYLTHLLFGWLALRAAERYVAVPVATAFGLAVAVFAAWVFYVCVERPAVQLSHIVAVRRRPGSATAVTR